LREELDCITEKSLSDVSKLEKVQDTVNACNFGANDGFHSSEEDTLNNSEQMGALRKEIDTLRDSEVKLKLYAIEVNSEIARRDSDIKRLEIDLSTLLDALTMIMNSEPESVSSVASFSDIYLHRLSTTEFYGTNPLHEADLEFQVSPHKVSVKLEEERGTGLILRDIKEAFAAFHRNSNTRIVELGFEVKKIQKLYDDVVIALTNSVEKVESYAKEVISLKEEIDSQQRILSDKDNENRKLNLETENFKVELAKVREALLQSEQELLILQIAQSSVAPGHRCSVCEISSSGLHNQSDGASIDTAEGSIIKLPTATVPCELEGSKANLEHYEMNILKTELEDSRRLVESLNLDLALCKNYQTVDASNVNSRSEEVKKILEGCQSRETNLESELQKIQAENDYLKNDLSKIRQALLQSEQERVMDQMSYNSQHSDFDFSVTGTDNCSYKESSLTQCSPMSDVTLSPRLNLGHDMLLSDASVATHRKVIENSQSKQEKEKEAIEKELVTVHEEVESLSLEVDVLKIEVDALLDVVAAREADLLTATHERDSMEQKLASTQVEEVRLKQLLETCESQLVSLQDRLDVSIATEKSLQVNLTELQLQFNRMSIEKDEAIAAEHKEIARLSAEIDVLNISNDALSDIISSKDTALIEASNTIEQLTTDKVPSIDDYNESSARTRQFSCESESVNIEEREISVTPEMPFTTSSMQSNSLDKFTDRLDPQSVMEKNIIQKEYDELSARNFELNHQLNHVLDEMESTRGQFGFVEELLAVSEAEVKRLKIELKETQKSLIKAKSELKKYIAMAKGNSETKTKAAGGRLHSSGQSRVEESELEKANIKVQALKIELEEARARIEQQEAHIFSLTNPTGDFSDSIRAIDFEKVVEQQDFNLSESSGPERSPGLPSKSRHLTPNEPNQHVDHPSSKPSNLYLIAGGSLNPEDKDAISVAEDSMMGHPQRTTEETSIENIHVTKNISAGTIDKACEVPSIADSSLLGIKAGEGEEDEESITDEVLWQERVKLLEDEIESLSEQLKKSRDDLQMYEQVRETLDNQLRKSQSSADALLQVSMVFEEKLKKMSSYSEAERVFLRTIFMESREILDTIEADLLNDIEKMRVYVSHLQSIPDPNGEFFQLKYEGLINEVSTMLEELTLSRNKVVMYGTYIEEKILSTAST